MPRHCSKRVSQLVVALAMASVTIALPARAGTATGAATEWTQVANNAELIKLLESSGTQVHNQLTQINQLAQQIETQLNIYQNMLQNTATLPEHIWGQVAADIDQLRSIIETGQSIAYTMGNQDDVLQQRFQSYSTLRTNLPSNTTFSSTYQTWSDTNRETIASTLRAAGLTSEQFSSEETTMSSLRTMSETADGQMKALQVGHQLAAQQVEQSQKLRALVSQQTTMTATWLQSEQTDKDLAQARRERFFEPTDRGVPEGEMMEPRW